jgi:hypothetical protein
MLIAAGVDLTRATVDDVLPVFKDFVRLPVDSASDGVLFEAGVFDFDGTDEFLLSFTRQLELVDAHGRHERFEQLQCTHQFEVDAGLRRLGDVEEWWFAGDARRLDAYFETIEQHSTFVALRGRRPLRFRVVQEAV